MKKKKTLKQSNLRVAISCEPLYKKGGAEVHLCHIMNTFPNCELFTAYYDKDLDRKSTRRTPVTHQSRMPSSA